MNFSLSDQSNTATYEGTIVSQSTGGVNGNGRPTQPLNKHVPLAALGKTVKNGKKIF